jgi:hypothetical protein
MKMRLLFVALAIALIGCNGVHVQTAIPQVTSSSSGVSSGECSSFQGVYQELVACARALGTLEAYSDPDIKWRLRFFFRYNEMPCGEDPTVEEYYAYQMAALDLSGDLDLTAGQRADIQAAIYPGSSSPPSCN